jgi:hypothetical protein
MICYNCKHKLKSEWIIINKFDVKAIEVLLCDKCNKVSKIKGVLFDYE